MNTKRIVPVLLSVLIFIVILGFLGCSDIPKVVYLQDSDGNVYFSGSSVYLGEVTSNSGATLGTKITTLNLVNQSGIDLTLSGSPDPVTFIHQTYQTKAGVTVYSTSASGHVVLDDSAIGGFVTAGNESGNISFTFNANATPPTLTNVIFRRKYIIEMTDGTESYDFVFEVYGFIVDSAGW